MSPKMIRVRKPHPHPGPHPEPECCDRLVAELRGIRDELHRLIPPVVGEGHTNIHVVGVELKPQEVPVSPIPVDHMPDFTLPSVSVRAKLAIVGPKLPGFATAGGPNFGKYAPSVTWSTSDESALPLEAIADDVVRDPVSGDPIVDENGNQIPVYMVHANTPLEPAPGETAGGVVTAKAAQMADVDIKVTYGDPAVGHMAITAAQDTE